MVERGKAFQIIANIFMIIILIICIAPFILLIASSLTKDSVLVREGYNFWPKEFSGEAYRYIFTQSTTMLRGYAISICITIIGTVINLFLTTLMAYPLSRRDLPYRNMFAFLVFFTMLFSGGLVPSYMMWTQIFHIKNTYWALLVPNLLLSAFNVIMMRTNISSNIPFECIESAKIEGSSEWQILMKIIMPMSIPIIATLAILVGLRYWNDWTNGLYYLSGGDGQKLYSIQNLLNQMITDIQYLASGKVTNIGSEVGRMPTVSIRMAIAFVAMIPLFIIYPFLQKYFAEGITLGAVKG